MKTKEFISKALAKKRIEIRFNASDCKKALDFLRKNNIGDPKKGMFDSSLSYEESEKKYLLENLRYRLEGMKTKEENWEYVFSVSTQTEVEKIQEIINS